MNCLGEVQESATASRLMKLVQQKQKWKKNTHTKITNRKKIWAPLFKAAAKLKINSSPCFLHFPLLNTTR